ncbi:hypothetical protein [Ramlibacter sp.]|uniref:hypothetical protein n=1 Tax=Ramlibacter sp. TaxID=1917967 RepID=UPI002C084996|nr:hypothetical protein [Ramlibacter sp.]HWI83847.1 hypothetical protein [Ramlibacter sp.]
MSFSFTTGRTATECRVQGASGRRLLGGYELIFNIQIRTAAHERSHDKLSIREWQASVNCGRKGAGMRPLGTAIPQSSTIVQTYDFENTANVALSIELTPGKLAELEQIRNGDDVDFQLNLSAIAHGWVEELSVQPGNANARTRVREQAQPMHDSIDHTIRLTEWTQILEQMDYQRTMVFSLVFPARPGGDQFVSAHRLLEQAREQLLRGHYEPVVSLCRKVMDSLVASSGEKEIVRAAASKYRESRETRESMTKRERALFLQEAARHYTHLAHHVNEQDGAPEWYSRGDATFCLALASAALSESVARQAAGLDAPTSDGAHEGASP